MCKTGQPHMWQARISARTNGTRCPYISGGAMCPCNNLAHNHPEVAAEWDWEANGERTPENVTTRSNIKAAWRCGLCGHRWSAVVAMRTRGTGCRNWEANERCGWHPDQVTLGSHKKVHWRRLDECKLGLVHRWQSMPDIRVYHVSGSPFPFGQAVCACNSLAVQCPEAADLWDSLLNEDLTPHQVTLQSHQKVFWRAPDGSQWHQKVREVVKKVQKTSSTFDLITSILSL